MGTGYCYAFAAIDQISQHLSPLQDWYIAMASKNDLGIIHWDSRGYDQHINSFLKVG